VPRLSKGFTVIELVVVLAIIALLAAVVVPNLGPRSIKYQHDEFVTRLNGLVNLGWQDAIATQKVHKIVFDLNNNNVKIFVETGKIDRKGDPIWEQMQSAYLRSEHSFSATFKVKNFYIQGVDAMRQPGLKTIDEVWFFLIPEGLAQDVIINILDTNETAQQEGRAQIGLILNPFNAQFKAYETFQKPS
jgi:prepilin-type N-terminal cleavage/methylation domain-containing protein